MIAATSTQCIGSFATRACNVGPRLRARRRKEAWQEMWKEVGASNKVRKEAADIWLKILNTTIFISFFMSHTFSVVHTAQPLLTTTTRLLHDSKISCSTNSSPGLPLSPPTDNFTTPQKMILALEEVVRMLLLLAGVESNHGPTYRMYLVHKPLVAEPRPHLHISCEDGGLLGDFGIFYSCSGLIGQLLCDTCSCKTCKDSAGAIYMPDFSILTVAHLNALLTNGETMVEGWEEKRRVLS